VQSLVLFLIFQQALWIDVPFVQQDKNGCGSASIWMIMTYWHPEDAVDPDAIQHQLYSKQAGGIYAKDMARYLESHGYRAFAFRGEWRDLEDHIAKGRPLIVSLEQNSRGAGLHYVVVAGVDTVEGFVLLNDPAQRKLLSMSRTDFEERWRATNNWTLLAVPELNLASSAFRAERLSETRDHLTAALNVNPADAYTNDFLGTVYFLENNTEAALKHWNRAGKPIIENIHIEPGLRTDPVLLDRAMSLSHGSLLRQSEFESTEARLEALHVFSRYRMELTPTDSGRFDLSFRAAERSRMNFWSWATGLPFQSVNPAFSNISGNGTNLSSAFRWDPDKKRAAVSLEAPLAGDPKWTLRTSLEGRDENWASESGGFRMRKVEAKAGIRSVPNGRWSWTSGAAISSRRTAIEQGIEVKYSGSVTRTLVRNPDKNLRVDSTIRNETGKFFQSSPLRFATLMNTTSLCWGSITSDIKLGSTIGQSPFDEHFMIGLERDSDLWLRAHTATIDGRKNASNVSRSFFITNSDYQKPVLNSGWFRLSAGPFVDTGKSSISSDWIVDTGLELRLNILGSVGFNVSYGRSITGGHHALFARQSNTL
jgi:predicted double-glycine peptidase